MINVQGLLVSGSQRFELVFCKARVFITDSLDQYHIVFKNFPAACSDNINIIKHDMKNDWQLQRNTK